MRNHSWAKEAFCSHTALMLRWQAKRDNHQVLHMIIYNKMLPILLRESLIEFGKVISMFIILSYCCMTNISHIPPKGTGYKSQPAHQISSLWAAMLSTDPKLGQVTRVVTGRASSVKARPNRCVTIRCGNPHWDNPKGEHQLILSYEHINPAIRRNIQKYNF